MNQVNSSEGPLTLGFRGFPSEPIVHQGLLKVGKQTSYQEVNMLSCWRMIVLKLENNHLFKVHYYVYFCFCFCSIREEQGCKVKERVRQNRKGNDNTQSGD